MSIQTPQDKMTWRFAKCSPDESYDAEMFEQYIKTAAQQRKTIFANKLGSNVILVTFNNISNQKRTTDAELREIQMFILDFNNVKNIDYNRPKIRFSVERLIDYQTKRDDAKVFPLLWGESHPVYGRIVNNILIMPSLQKTLDVVVLGGFDSDAFMTRLDYLIDMNRTTKTLTSPSNAKIPSVENTAKQTFDILYYDERKPITERPWTTVKVDVDFSYMKKTGTLSAPIDMDYFLVTEFTEKLIKINIISKRPDGMSQYDIPVYNQEVVNLINNSEISSLFLLYLRHGFLALFGCGPNKDQVVRIVCAYDEQQNGKLITKWEIMKNYKMLSGDPNISLSDYTVKRLDNFSVIILYNHSIEKSEIVAEIVNTYWWKRQLYHLTIEGYDGSAFLRDFDIL
jgi:hypothetical protein